MLNAEDRNELDHLRKALVTFADSAKVDLNPIDANNNSPEQIFEAITRKLEKQQRSKGSLGRLFGSHSKVRKS
jgi:hypothetical protein